MNKKNVVKLPVKSRKKAPKEKGLLKEGTIGDLKYKIYDRGNIHITDGINIFRKDREQFKKALLKKDYEKINEGGSFEIPGAGDTDPLIIYKEDGEFKLRVGVAIPPIIAKLKKILDEV